MSQLSWTAQGKRFNHIFCFAWSPKFWWENMWTLSVLEFWYILKFLRYLGGPQEAKGRERQNSDLKYIILCEEEFQLAGPSWAQGLNIREQRLCAAGLINLDTAFTPPHHHQVPFQILWCLLTYREWGCGTKERTRGIQQLCVGIPFAGGLVRSRCFSNTWRGRRAAELGLVKTNWP